MPAKFQDIYDASVKLPDFIVVDASLFLELAPSNPKSNFHHGAASSFLARAQSSALNGSLVVILPLVALAECYHNICRWIIEPVAKASKSGWVQYAKKNPHIMAGAVPFLRSFTLLLQMFPVQIPEPDMSALKSGHSMPLLSDTLLENMDRFELMSKDALIIAEAERLGVFTLATLDADWKRADGFTVIAPP